MPAYAYPIIIRPRRQKLQFKEQFRVEGSLSLSALSPAREDAFDIEQDEIGDGWTVTVYRERLETETERDARVAGEKSYMAEYHRRHPVKNLTS